MRNRLYETGEWNQMEQKHSSETSVHFQWNICHYIPEERNLCELRSSPVKDGDLHQAQIDLDIQQGPIAPTAISFRRVP